MVSRIREFVGLAAAIAVVAALAAPASASAADTYADANAPDNSGDCLTQATACQTIGGVDGALSKSDPGDTTFVADGTYAESFVLGDGKSLVALDATDPKPVIDNGSAPNPAVTVDSGGAGSVDGFTIRSDFGPMQIFGSVIVANNTFDEDSVPSNLGSDIDLHDAGSVLIMANVFTDPDATGAQAGVSTSDTTTPLPTIASNTFSGLATGIAVSSGNPTISGNQFSGAHSAAADPGVGISVTQGRPTITQNEIGSPAGGPSVGVLISPSGGPASADLSRNEISANDVGVKGIDFSYMTLQDDLIHGNAIGLEASGPTVASDVLADGETFDNDTDVSLQQQVVLHLSSSILSTPIQLQDAAAGCDIHYSRGPSGPASNGCGDFDTNADPQFVDPASDDYRLQSSSPLIDIGDPSDPGPGAVDFYGNPRAVQGLSCDAARRDIGAAEFQPNTPPPPCNQDTYVDANGGNDSNDCLSAGGNACQTIGAALAKMGPNHTTFVADGTYNESVTVDQSKSLESLDSTDPRPIIDAGSGTGITVAPGGADTVSGLRVRSSGTGMEADGPVTVETNVFEATGSDASLLKVEASSVLIDSNSFEVSGGSGFQVGIAANGPDPVISGNTFTGLAAGVFAVSGNAQISGNQFSGAHPTGPTLMGDLPGVGVLVTGTPTITNNTFGAPAQNPSAGVYVGVLPIPSPPPSGAILARNQISGNDVGVQVADASAPVTLDSDLLYGNDIGLEATDTSGDSPPSTQGDVSATNVTFENTSDVSIDHTTLTLDSSIVSTPIDLVGGNGACDITYSDGPTGTSGNGCGNFDTGTAPQFVDPGNGDYHLQSSSPLIDIGNPADPGPGALDFYGDPREVQGAACDLARRDIGADEYNPGSPPQCAQDTYANVGTGDDNNDCLSAASACETIAAALSKSADDQTTFVADGTYPESLTLDGGRSLIASDASDPKPLIDPPAGTTAIEVPGGGAGEISGLHIRSDHLAVDASGPVDINHNLFDSPDTTAQTDVSLEGSSSVVVSDNQFVDPGASGVLFGVVAGVDSVISDNTFTDLAGGVEVFGGQPQVSGNQFTGMHAIGATPFGNLPGAGVMVFNATPTITQNTFGAASGHPSTGIYIRPYPPAPAPTGATISRNRISDNDVGVQVIDSDSPVTLEDDLIYGNTTGIESTDTSADSPPSTQGDVSATNETIFDNAVDASVSYTTLTLGSSILGTPIDVVGNNGACDITYSRGSPASSNGCGNFDTNAAPQFVDAASGDYQLQSSSPLIDTGDPASPGPGAVDFYGGPRELQGKQCSTARRDIGAAEYDPGTTPGCPPPPSPPAPTPTPTPTPEPPAAPKINKQPDRRSDDTTPTFKFSGEVPGSSFRCKLDGAPYRACSSPKTYRGLDVGRHIFRVYAIDPSGKKGSPRVIRFTVTN